MIESDENKDNVSGKGQKKTGDPAAQDEGPSSAKQARGEPTMKERREAAKLHVAGEDDPSYEDYAQDEHDIFSFDEAEEADEVIEELRSENAELKERLVRLMADMENLRRRTQREKEDTAKYAISNFALDVLKIGDNLARALESVRSANDDNEKTAALDSLLEGVEMTERQMLTTMEKHGIVRIDPEGERFDPNLHQAMYEVPDTSVNEGTVMQVVQPGYSIGDRVLRPAMVGVSKGGPKWPPAAAGEEDAPKNNNDDSTRDDEA